MNPVFYFVVDHSHPMGLRPERPDLLSLWAESKPAGRRMKAVIKSDRPSLNRSELQNRYYFGVVVKMIAQACGDDEQSTHEALAHKFAPLNLGSTLPGRRSTATMDTEEFSNYIDVIRRWAGGFLGIIIPSPNDVDLENVVGFIPDR